MPRRELEPIRPGRVRDLEEVIQRVNKILRTLNRDANAIDRRALHQRRRQRLMATE